MANKVQFGLKNVYYSVLTETGASAPSYGTPKKLDGAVSIELSQEGAEVNFYADNIEYFRAMSNNGYKGSLEIAKISEEALKDIWGFGFDNTAKVVYEASNAEPNPIALLFQIEGDANEERYCFYKVYCARPNVSSATIDDGGKDPKPQTLDITCLPIIDNSANSKINGKIYAKTGAETTTTVKNAWFSSVFVNFA